MFIVTIHSCFIMSNNKVQKIIKIFFNGFFLFWTTVRRRRKSRCPSNSPLNCFHLTALRVMDERRRTPPLAVGHAFSTWPLPSFPYTTSPLYPRHRSIGRIVVRVYAILFTRPFTVSTGRTQRAGERVLFIEHEIVYSFELWLLQRSSGPGHRVLFFNTRKSYSVFSSSIFLHDAWSKPERRTVVTTDDNFHQYRNNLYRMAINLRPDLEELHDRTLLWALKRVSYKKLSIFITIKTSNQ